jgi:hypothetical protein
MGYMQDSASKKYITPIRNKLSPSLPLPHPDLTYKSPTKRHKRKAKYRQ